MDTNVIISTIFSKRIIRQNEMQPEKIKGRTQIAVSGGGGFSGPLKFYSNLPIFLNLYLYICMFYVNMCIYIKKIIVEFQVKKSSSEWYTQA